jgi:cellulose biosynthesis protein BcsQ
VFTVNALTAADAVLVPLQAHVFALKAMPQLEETIGIVRQLNPALRIGGIAVTMVDRRTSVNTLVEDAIRQQYGDTVFQTVIPFNVKLVESPAAGQPISVYAGGGDRRGADGREAANGGRGGPGDPRGAVADGSGSGWGSRGSNSAICGNYRST